MTRRIIALLTLSLALVAALPAAEDVNGKWHFVLETEGGPREADAEFNITGEDVAGSWGGAPVKGVYKEGKLELSFPFNSPEAGEGTLKISGQLESGSLTGTWSFSTYSGTFKAARS